MPDDTEQIPLLPETSLTLPTNATIIAGGRVYRMAVLAYTGQDELEAAKSRLMVEARQAAEAAALQIRQTAQASAEAILRDARQQQERAEAALRSAGANQPPAWAVTAGHVMRWKLNHDSGQHGWAIRMTIPVRIEGFDWRGYAIPAKQGSRQLEPVNHNLWLPLRQNGTWAVTSIHADEAKDQLPHITTGSSCLTLGDAARPVQTNEDFHEVINSLTRAMARVQMDSLLCVPKVWRARLERFIPDTFNTVLKSAGYEADPNIAMRAYLTAQNIAAPTVEGAVWTAPAAR